MQANQNQSSISTLDTEASKINKGSGPFNTYVNTDYGISIIYPKMWKPSEVNLPQHGIVLFNAPEAEDKPTSYETYVYNPARLLIATQSLPFGNMTLDQYITFLFKEAYDNATQSRVINSQNGTLAGMDARKIVMYEYWPDGTFKVMRNIALDTKTKIVYFFKYSAHPGKFSYYLPVVQHMMDSLTVK